MVWSKMKFRSAIRKKNLNLSRGRTSNWRTFFFWNKRIRRLMPIEMLERFARIVTRLPHKQVRYVVERCYLNWTRTRHVFHVRGRHKKRKNSWQVKSLSKNEESRQESGIGSNSISQSSSSDEWDKLSSSSGRVNSPPLGTEIKCSYAPDPAKYAPMKTDIKDLSSSVIDYDDCCIVFEKSVSSVENGSCDSVKKSVAKEEKNVEEDTAKTPDCSLMSGTSEILSPLLVKIMKNLSERVDNTASVRKLAYPVEDAVEDAVESEAEESNEKEESAIKEGKHKLKEPLSQEETYKTKETPTKEKTSKVMETPTKGETEELMETPLKGETEELMETPLKGENEELTEYPIREESHSADDLNREIETIFEENSDDVNSVERIIPFEVYSSSSLVSVAEGEITSAVDKPAENASEEILEKDVGIPAESTHANFQSLFFTIEKPCEENLVSSLKRCAAKEIVPVLETKDKTSVTSTNVNPSPEECSFLLPTTKSVVEHNTKLADVGINTCPVSVVEVSESLVPVPLARTEDPRPVMIDAEMNPSKQKKLRCHCRMSNLKIRCLHRKVTNLKKLLILRTKTCRVDRDAYASLIKDHSKVMKSVVRVLRSQVSFNEDLLNECRELVSQGSRFFTEKQSPRSNLEAVNKDSKAASTKPEAKSENRPEAKPEGKPEYRPEIKPEGKAEGKLENRPEIKPEGKAENKLENRPEIKPEGKAEGQPENKPEIKPENRPEEVKCGAKIESGMITSATRRLFIDEKQSERHLKCQVKKRLSLSHSSKSNGDVLMGWDAVRRRAEEIQMKKCRSPIMEFSGESSDTKDSSQDISGSQTTENSSTVDFSELSIIPNNMGSPVKEDTLEEEARTEEETVKELKACLEELKADEEDKLVEELPKKRKHIRFEENATGEGRPTELRRSQRLRKELECKSAQDDQSNRGKGKTSLSSDDDTWNQYVENLVRRLAEEYSVTESLASKESFNSGQLETSKGTVPSYVEFRNEDILSYLFLDEQFAFRTRKIDPDFTNFPYEEKALGKILSDLRSNGDLYAAENAVYSNRISGCSNNHSFRKQLRQYLKAFSPLAPFYFQVHLDIQTGIETIRIMVTEARYCDDRIDFLEGTKVGVTTPYPGNLLKFVENKGTGDEKVSVLVGPASYANHFCSPNAKLVSIDRHKVGVVATRDILSGEELLIAQGSDFCCACPKNKMKYQRKSWKKAKLDLTF